MATTEGRAFPGRTPEALRGYLGATFAGPPKLRSPPQDSTLYFDIKPEQEPLIYHESYDISFLGIENLHPFDSKKWGKILAFLKQRRTIKEQQVVKPNKASTNDLLAVHTEEYLLSLKSSAQVASITEVAPVALLPNFLVRRNLLNNFKMQTGGSVLAGKLAVERGWAINLGGGFHHCCGCAGGGFCAFADITLCAYFARDRLPGIQRVMVIDLDAHQGNGHERDLMG
ncbi:histone deacetylase, partial [Cymbomonas tetramitiformis]